MTPWHTKTGSAVFHYEDFCEVAKSVDPAARVEGNGDREACPECRYWRTARLVARRTERRFFDGEDVAVPESLRQAASKY